MLQYYRLMKSGPNKGGSRVKKTRPTYIRGALFAVIAAWATPLFAQQLNVICPVQAEWCSLAATEFEKETGIKVGLTLKGSGEAFEYLKALHKNINNYPRSGVGPIKAAARGETLASVSFIHDVVTEAQAGFPVKAVAPCEGTGYEIGSLSIVKGARNLENAKKFYDWALTPKAQALGAQAKQFQLPSNVSTAISPLSPKVADIKLINYDFGKYGSSAERKRLLERWDKEVGSVAK